MEGRSARRLGGLPALRLVLKGALLLGIVGFAVWVNLHGVESEIFRETVRSWGYPGLFVLSALSGFNLLVPIPVILFFPFLMELGLHPVGALAVIALGMTCGDLVGYLLGSMGRDVFELPDTRIVRRIRALGGRRWLPYAILFGYAAFIPFPNEVLVIPMAFLGFSLAGIFGAALLGNLVFNSLAALSLTGVFGVG